MNGTVFFFDIEMDMQALFTNNERLHLERPEVDGRLRSKLDPQPERGVTAFATIERRISSSLYKYKGSLLHKVALAGEIVNPEDRITELFELSKIIDDSQEPEYDGYDLSLVNRWLRDSKTDIRFSPFFIKEYIDAKGVVSFTKMMGDGSMLGYNQHPPQRGERSENVNYYQSRYGFRLDDYAYDAIGSLLRVMTVGFLKDRERPGYREAPTIEKISRLFTRAILFRIGLNTTTFSQVEIGGFPTFRFEIDGLRFSTSPGGFFEGHYGSRMDLIDPEELERVQYSKLHQRILLCDISIRTAICESIAWWLIHQNRRQIPDDEVVIDLPYNAKGRSIEIIDIRIFANLPQLLERAGFVNNVDTDDDIIDLMERFRTMDHPPSKGKYIRRRIREWLERNPDIRVLSQPKGMPDRTEYCLLEGPNGLDRLPEDLRPWFNPLRVWLVPDPYSIMRDDWIDRVVAMRSDELGVLHTKNPSIAELPYREQLFVLDSEANGWTEFTRHPVNNNHLLVEIAEIAEDDQDDEIHIAYRYYYATRGIGEENPRHSTIEFIEAYSGYRSEEELREITILLNRGEDTEIGEMIGHPYSWNIRADQLLHFIKTGEVGDITPERREESIRYLFYKRMTVEQHRQASALYMDDPETPMERDEYVTLVVQDDYREDGVREDPELEDIKLHLSPLDPITLDLSKPKVFEETVKRLKVVFPLQFGLESISRFDDRHAYLIGGLYRYNRLLSRDLNVERSAIDLIQVLTDEEILRGIGCYPEWRKAEELRERAIALLRGQSDFFFPIEPRCRNTRAVVGLEEIQELAEQRLVIAFGMIDSHPAVEDGVVVTKRGLSAAGISADSEDRSAAGISRGDAPLREPGGLPAAGISRGDASLREPGYLCYTLYDLAAGFRPAGLHSDIYRYAILEPTGSYRELDDRQVDTLLNITKGIFNTLGDEDRRDAQEMIDNIAVIKRRLIEYTEKDQVSRHRFETLLSAPSAEGAEESIRNYLHLLFEYGMYLRRWRGPGHAYPMSEAETLCSQFDMNSDLLAPTGRLQEAHRALSLEGRDFIDSLPMKHYYDGSYQESANSTVSDLIYQLNRQDDGNLCIRMGSTKVIGSAYYYLELLFQPSDIRIVNFNIDELVRIQ